MALFERQSSVTFRPADGWRPIPGYGFIGVENIRLGRAIVRRMPLRTVKMKWNYTVEQPGAVQPLRAEGVDWSESSFEMSPVTEFVCAGENTTYPLTGVPSDSEIAFTIARPIALLRRDLVIPAIRLSNYIAQ